MANLTKRSVDALKPRGKLYIVFDGGVKGFGVRIMPSGVKTFVLEYRPSGGGRGVNKKRLAIGRYGSMTCDQAREAALDALARIRQGNDPSEEKSRQRASVTVGQIIDAFLRDLVSVKLKSSTRVHYEEKLTKVRSSYGALKAVSLTRTQVSALHQSMASTPYSANRMLSAISSCWAWCERCGLLPESHPNPATKIVHFREQGRERFLSGEELGRLGDALREHEPRFGPHAIAAIRLLALTGMRLGEVLSLRWIDVDFERGLATLPDSKAGRKTVRLAAPALAILAALPRLAGCPYVIAGRNGRRLDLQRPWEAVRDAAGLSGVRIYDLRHSYASAGAGASMGLPIIGKLLGHSQPSTTARYAHLGDDPLRLAAESIGTSIAALMDRKSA